MRLLHRPLSLAATEGCCKGPCRHTQHRHAKAVEPAEREMAGRKRWRRSFLLDGVLRNFDLGKVPLCLFVRGKLGDRSVTELASFPLHVAVLDLDLDLDQTSQVWPLKSWLETWVQTTANIARNRLAKSFC